MSDNLNLKLSPALRKQLARIAMKVGRSPEQLAIDLLEQELPRKELMADFVREALASDANAEAGGPVYRAEDVYRWMERRARGENPPRPDPKKQ